MSKFDTIVFGPHNTKIPANLDENDLVDEWQTKELYCDLREFYIDNDLIYLYQDNRETIQEIPITATFEIYTENESLVVTAVEGEILLIQNPYKRLKVLPKLPKKS